MKYNTTCSKCGKPVHHKQIIWQETFYYSTISALLNLPVPSYNIRLCFECVKPALKFLVDSLEGNLYKHFITKYGEIKYAERIRTNEESNGQNLWNQEGNRDSSKDMEQTQ